MEKALLLWSKMLECGLELIEVDYKLLLVAATHFDDETVAARILTDVSEDIFVPNEATRKAICDWFATRGKPSSGKVGGSSLFGTNTALSNIAAAPQHSQPFLLPSMKADAGYDIEQLSVDENGTYWHGGKSAQLQSIEISVASCVELLKMNEEIVLRGGVTGHQVSHAHATHMPHTCHTHATHIPCHAEVGSKSAVCER